jgi:hypothetical protein
VRGVTNRSRRGVAFLLAQPLAPVYLHLVSTKTTAAVAEMPKPVVRPVAPTEFAVAFRGQSGRVFKDTRSERWHALRHTSEQTCEGIARVCWTSKEAFDALVARLNDVADCHEAAVASDKAASAGLRKRLAELGGEAALAAYDAALVKVTRDDVTGVATVVGMIKAASARKLPKVVDVAAVDYAGQPYRVRVVPGFSVQVNEQTYFIGGQAEYGSYNLHYFGEIKNITANTITVAQNDTGRSANKRLKINEFAWRNAGDVTRKHARNVAELQCI